MSAGRQPLHLGEQHEQPVVLGGGTGGLRAALPVDVGHRRVQVGQRLDLRTSAPHTRAAIEELTEHSRATNSTRFLGSGTTAPAISAQSAGENSAFAAGSSRSMTNERISARDETSLDAHASKITSSTTVPLTSRHPPAPRPDVRSAGASSSSLLSLTCGKSALAGTTCVNVTLPCPSPMCTAPGPSEMLGRAASGRRFRFLGRVCCCCCCCSSHSRPVFLRFMLWH